MRVRLKLLPGQRGTKKMLLKYGDRLVCVRYRYDELKHKRYKTVELIEEEIPWHPRPKPDAIVHVKINPGEWDLARKARQAGGQWDRAKKLWALRYDKVVELGLQERIVWPAQ